MKRVEQPKVTKYLRLKQMNPTQIHQDLVDTTGESVVPYKFKLGSQSWEKKHVKKVYQDSREAIRQTVYHIMWPNLTWKNYLQDGTTNVNQYRQTNLNRLVGYPPYSPNLAPSDYQLFPKLKEHFLQTSMCVYQ